MCARGHLETDSGREGEAAMVRLDSLTVRFPGYLKRCLQYISETRLHSRFILLESS